MSKIAVIEAYPAVRVKRILVIGNGVQPQEVPTSFRFDAFLYFPDEMGAFLDLVQQLAARSRRRGFSPYHCPTCHGRLTCNKTHASELFCPRCHTTVSILDGDRCLVQAGQMEPSRNYRLEDLEA